MRRKSSMFQQPLMVKSILTDKLRRLGLLKEVNQHQAMLAFVNACGPMLRKHATPDRIDRGTLYVKVAHSAWIQEMTCMKPELLLKTQSLPGGEQVRDLRFLIGDIDKSSEWETETSLG